MAGARREQGLDPQQEAGVLLRADPADGDDRAVVAAASGRAVRALVGVGHDDGGDAQRRGEVRLAGADADGEVGGGGDGPLGGAQQARGDRRHVGALEAEAVRREQDRGSGRGAGAGRDHGPAHQAGPGAMQVHDARRDGGQRLAQRPGEPDRPAAGVAAAGEQVLVPDGHIAAGAAPEQQMVLELRGRADELDDRGGGAAAHRLGDVQDARALRRMARPPVRWLVYGEYQSNTLCRHKPDGAAPLVPLPQERLESALRFRLKFR